MNPNLVILRNMYYYWTDINDHPPDWEYLLRDEHGEIAFTGDEDRPSATFIDFTHPEWQDIVVGRAIAAKDCGFYDGIFLDHWGLRLAGYKSAEEEFEVRDSILKRIREAVGDDFLILVNSGVPDVLRWKDYVNGVFFETHGGIKGENPNVNIGHTREHIANIEREVRIAESSLAEPVINCVEGYGLSLLMPDHPENLRWMRVFTTMMLTNSDGYVVYNIGAASANHEHGWDNEYLQDEPGHVHDHDHYWYEFWDADLGEPISQKSQLYENREGLFIREFARGWAVYNRSGSEQEIQFGSHVSGKASEFGGTTHTIPDLDGEIYLKLDRADINADGEVNILDLVTVANAFGETGGGADANRDGIVNILDLVLVANSF